MKPTQTLSGRRLIAFAIGWLATVVATFAQTTGTIQGRVFNPVSKDYVRNAEVRLEGANRVAYTENDGSFQFTGVSAGEATITVTYTGYNTEKQTFTVAAGQTAAREVNLTSASAAPAAGAAKDGVITLQAFTVASEREGNAKAIMAQRRNMDISTSVSSDIFGEVADGNVGEFLKYLPGVDLDYVESEARGPRLGGMDAQYVGVSFDGMKTASADANRGGGESSRATSFEGFAITAIESIEISRTSSADSPGDSPAGTINMKTKRAFDRKGRRFNYNFGLNMNAEEFTLKRTAGPSDGFHLKALPNYSIDYSESFFNQKFGVLLSASHANSYTEQYEVDHSYNRTPDPSRGDSRPLVLRQINFKDGNKFIVKDSYLLTMDWRVSRNLVLSLNGQYTYTEGEFWNRNFTFVAANDNSNANVANGRAQIGGDGVTSLIAERTATNNQPRIGNGGGSASKLTYTRSLSPRFEYKHNSWLFEGGMNYSRSVNNYESLERGFSSSEGGQVDSSWTATRPNAESWEWTIRQTAGPDWFQLANYTNTNNRDGGTRVNNDDRTWVTEIWSGQVNATWSLPFIKSFPTRLKFGGRWDEEDRENNNMSDWNIWSYVGPGGNTVTENAATGAFQNATFGNWANVGPDFVSPHPFDMGTTNGLTIFNVNGQQGMPQRASRNTIATLFRAKPEQFVHMGTPENFFATHINNRRDFRQTVTSGYGQADVRVTQKLQLRAGVRLEETVNSVMEFDPLTRAQVAAAGFAVNAPGTNSGRAVTYAGLRHQYMSNPRIERESKYHNYFPSATAKYQIMQDLEFQVGFNKAISRPPIDSITGLWNVDEQNSRVSAPNAELMPEHSKNYQARIARYFSGRSPGSLAISVSQNDIRNLREQFDYSASEFGVDDPDFAAYTFRTTRNSAERRRFRNMGIAYNQTLGFLPGEYLRGMNFGVTYDRTYASQRRNGMTPHRMSSRLGYNYRRFNGSLGMVWNDDKPDGIYGRYKREITQFDLSMSFRLTRWATVYVDGRNITGRPVLWGESAPGLVEGHDPRLRRLQEYGANWKFGVRGQF